MTHLPDTTSVAVACAVCSLDALHVRKSVVKRLGDAWRVRVRGADMRRRMGRS